MSDGLLYDQTIPEGRIIARTELAWSFLSYMPIVPGHTIVLPVRIVARFEELTEAERDELFSLMATVQSALAKTFDAKGFNIAWNEGEESGQSVPHFHMHVLPRKKGDSGITGHEPRKFIYRPDSREPSPESELAAVASQIRAALR